MSTPMIVLLDATTVRVFSAGDATSVRSATWKRDGGAPELTRAMMSLVSSSDRSVPVALVIGLGLLEIAQPELPAIDAERVRVLLVRDADRYFPVEGAVAVSWSAPFAFAVPSPDLGMWVQAASNVGRVQAITTVPECLLRAGVNGTHAVDAAEHEAGLVRLDHGTLMDVRRTRVGVLSDGASPSAARASELLSLIARGAVRTLGGPLHTMLLDDGAEQLLRRGRRARWMASALLLAASLLLVAWSADRWRTRTLDAADSELARLSAEAAPAQRAQARLAVARSEMALVDRSDTGPSAVLARIGALLPRDAFVERLEWDGTVWRIDGSASNAPAIVPLLDGDPMFTDVRIAAATTRFMDAGRQRESFSVAFRLRARGGANAAP